MEKIQMVDLQSQYQRIKTEIDDAISAVLSSAHFIQGKQVQAFSNELAAYVQSPYAVTCANGTDALQIAMMALGFKPDDEVILPVHTYVATAEVLALLGLTPVFVDVDDKTFNIDISRIEDHITERTVAIVPVHLYGQCADMEPLLMLGKKYGVHVIEDAAQALGAIYTFHDGSKKRAGTMGTIGTTSFFPSKNLGCFGDGGALFTNDSDLAEKIKMIANHGQREKYQHDIVGINSRLDTIQAAILRVKLKYLDEYEQKRKAVADGYDRLLSGLANVVLPFRSLFSTHVFHQYTLQLENGDRDAFKDYLAGHGIPSMVYYPRPLHLQPAYRRDEQGQGSFPVTERLSKTVISLPIHTEMSAGQQEFIAETIKGYF
jgi:dTDP-4-amino-4,6-dideoxygalactose transaminase